MIIYLEGVRKSGKSHTCQVLEKQNYNIYKDIGISSIKNKMVDIDDYAIGRDLAYAQFAKNIDKSIIFDRGYLSSCVYGMFYRKKYDAKFWENHQDIVEEFYKGIDVSIVFLKVRDFIFLSQINREKDNLESTKMEDYITQYELYNYFLNRSKLKVRYMESFCDDSYILEQFK